MSSGKKQTQQQQGKKAVAPAAVVPSEISKSDAKAAKKRELMLAIQDQMQGSGLSNSQPGAQASTCQARKHASRVLKYDLGWTLHAGTGKQGTNLLLKFAIHAWEKEHLKRALFGLPADGMWFDKKESLNLSKVSTPELARLIIDAVKVLCPDSAANMSGDLAAPADYVAPVIIIVLADALCINGEEIDKPTMFFIGKMFVLKDCLKEMFGVRYGDIEFGGTLKAAWFVHIKDGSEVTIATWLKKMGWTVEVKDTRDDEADEEEE